jgi:hypothetical protein
MRAGHNQYPMMTGVPPLREAIAAKIGPVRPRVRPGHEITVTAGATQALTTAILCCVHPGDEVIVIEPAYDSYLPAIALAGGVPVPVRCAGRRQGYSVPWDEGGGRGDAAHAPDRHQHAAQPDRLGAARADLSALPTSCAAPTSWSCPTRSTSTWSTTASATNRSRRHPELAARAFVVSSFGKTYHVTGWKVGYCRRAGGAHRGVPQGPPVQCVHREHADAARPGRLHGRPAPYLICRRSTSASATCSARAWRSRASNCCRPTAPISSACATTPSCFAKQDSTLHMALDRLTQL